MSVNSKVVPVLAPVGARMSTLGAGNPGPGGGCDRASPLVSKTAVPGNAIQVMYNVDLHDGVGLRKGSARLGRWGPQAMSVDASNIPARFADEENATLLAVIRSYQQNEQMMAQQRQGAMNRVQADAARANAQAAALNARREASNAAFDQHMGALNAQSSSFNSHMDDIDRSSKVNQDYILDRTVVRDNENDGGSHRSLSWHR